MKMDTQEITKKIRTLKMHIDEMEDWMKQATEMLYDLEDKVLDMQERMIETSFSNHLVW
jgi:uncharacterized protein (DUF342 family)